MEKSTYDQASESFQLKTITNQTDFDFNLLSLLPKEILDEVMIYLKHDISFEGLLFCYKHLHKKITKNLAKLIAQNIYKKFLFKINSIDELNKKISAKRKAISEVFPNYNVIDQAYSDYTIGESNELNGYCLSLFQNLKTAIIGQNSVTFNNNTENLEFNILKLSQQLNEENKVTLKTLLLIIKNTKNRLKAEVIWYSIAKEIISNPIPLMCTCMLLLGYIRTLLALFNDRYDLAMSGKAFIEAMALSFMLFLIVKHDFVKPVTDITLKTLSELSDKIDNILKDSNINANLHTEAQ